MTSSRRVIAVIGMHRSGTSAMTRALGYLGASLGDTFIDAMPEVNAKGFWEDADFNRINIAVLRYFGLDWLSHRPVDQGRFAEPGLLPIIGRAEKLLRERLDDTGLFAFKDPRTTLVLPFWKMVFAQAEVTDDYLIAIRHPSAVAESLARRNGFEAAKSLNLWLRYTVEALQKSALRGRRILVDYDTLLDNPAVSLRRISQSLNLPEPAASAAAEFSTQFLSSDLRHCKPVCASFAEPAMALYSALLPVARDEAPLDGEVARKALQKASAYLGNSAPLLAYLDRVEQAAALGGDASEGEFAWLHTLRSSFGVASSQKATPDPPRPTTLRKMLGLLGRHKA